MAAKDKTGAGLIGSADFLFSCCGGKDPQNGEDSYVFSINESMALIGAFGGCGGASALRYPKMKNKTGAYLAAHSAAAAYRDWFDALRPGEDVFAREQTPPVREYLQLCAEHCGEAEGRVPGGLSACAAVALCRSSAGAADVLLQWAGDSRVYLLDGEGLAQLTEDDLGGMDAMRDLQVKGRPTNAISLTRPFRVHTGRLTVGRPGLLFAATDGCFDALSTPMEFEYLLLRTLQSSPSASDWEKTLGAELGRTAKEDFALSGICLGFGSYDDLKRQLAGRASRLYRTYIHGLDACSDEEKQQLWEHYKARYLRHLCRP